MGRVCNVIFTEGNWRFHFQKPSKNIGSETLNVSFGRRFHSEWPPNVAICCSVMGLWPRKTSLTWNIANLNVMNVCIVNRFKVSIAIEFISK